MQTISLSHSVDRNGELLLPDDDNDIMILKIMLEFQVS